MSDAFDWAHIPDLACINAADLIELVYDDRSPGEARALLAREAPSPDEAFLKRGPDAWDMARVLRRDWLGEDMQALDQVYNEAQGSDLIEMAKRPVSQRVKLKRIEKAHLRDGLRQILLRALFAAGTPEVDLDRLDLDSTFVIVPTSGRRGDLFRHQDLAVRHLHARWRRDGLAMRGLLVMPTGSGKTRTAVAWLIDDVIASGRQVLWVTHSRELLRQTARAFIEDAPRLKRHGRDDLRIRLDRRHADETIIVLACAAYVVPAVAMAVIPGVLGAALAYAPLMLANAVCAATLMGARARRVPQSLQALAGIAGRTLVMAGLAAGAALGGVMAEIVGTRGAYGVVALALACTAIAAAPALARVRDRRLRGQAIPAR